MQSSSIDTKIPTVDKTNFDFTMLIIYQKGCERTNTLIYHDGLVRVWWISGMVFVYHALTPRFKAMLLTILKVRVTQTLLLVLTCLFP